MCVRVECWTSYMYVEVHILVGAWSGSQMSFLPSVSATRDLWEIDEKYKIKIQSATRLNVAKDTSVHYLYTVYAYTSIRYLYAYSSTRYCTLCMYYTLYNTTCTWMYLHHVHVGVDSAIHFVHSSLPPSLPLPPSSSGPAMGWPIPRR